MMTGKVYRELIEELGMTQRGASYLLGISERSSRRFASGAVIPLAIQLLLILMVEKKVTPQKMFELAGLKIPAHGFGDRRENGK